MSDLEGGVQLSHSDGRDPFKPFGSSFHPNWRESGAQLTEKQAVLLMHDIYVVPVQPPQYDYDDPHANVIDQLIPSTFTGATAWAPPFSFTAWCIIHLRFNNTFKYGFMIHYSHTIFYIIGINM